MSRLRRIALCQIDTLPGDIPGNVDLIVDAATRAAEGSAELCVFPELAVVGYCPRDLLFRERFVEAAEAALEDLARRCPVPVLVGTVRRNQGAGRPFRNVAVLIADGRVEAVVSKGLLPAYDVFDEARYFEPLTSTSPVTWRGLSLGITICEDIWVERQGQEVPVYGRDPVDELVGAGADVIVNLSASPYHAGRPGARAGLVSRTAARVQRPVLLCNLWGGNDEILFDGASVAANADGTLTHRARTFGDDCLLVDLEAMTSEARVPDATPTDELREALVCGLRDYARKCGFSAAVIGLSGGIDSAVTACLAVEALGKENVRGISLPSEFSSQGSVSDARALADMLGIAFHVAPIAGVYDQLLGGALDVVGEGPFGVMEENLQARARGALLMAVSNRTGALLVTTGNKSELAVGYCTLYGDMCGGLAAISDVYKMDVYALARAFHAEGKLPEASITKPPSAELRPGQKDEDSLPPYDVLDRILRLHVDQNLGARAIVERVPEADVATVERIVHLVARSEYKRRQAAPGLRVSAKAFGVGRRIPIAASALGFLDGDTGERR